MINFMLSFLFFKSQKISKKIQKMKGMCVEDGMNIRTLVNKLLEWFEGTNSREVIHKTEPLSALPKSTDSVTENKNFIEPRIVFDSTRFTRYIDPDSFYRREIYL
jgi:hypothetical protein